MIKVEQPADQQLTAPRARTSPYQGLLPYSEEDADYFCGRAAWTEIVTDHLLAYRVTLLYGPSGVGKSSLLRAGVVHDLLDVARENLVRTGSPELLPAIVSGWSGDPVAGVEAALEDAATKVFGPLRPSAEPGSLGAIVSQWATRVGGRVLLVLDQFDEYFMYHEARPGGLAFVDTLSDLIADREIPVNLLISIREDALAKLDRFADPNVDLWQNLLRVDHLDADAAHEAIEEPLARWNKREAHDGPDVTAEPALVDAVVAAANPRTIRIGDAGRGVVDAHDSEAPEGGVEAPYLQLVMTRLWEEERRRGSSVLRFDTLNRRLGGAEQIVRRHFDGVMRTLPRRQRARAAKIMEYLVTPTGTKIALPPSALAKWSKQKEKKITPILTKLAGGEQRILRTVTSPGDPKGATSYEIFHDRLADGILDWRTRYVRRRRRIRISSVAFVVLAAGAFGALGAVYNQHQRAEQLSSDLKWIREQKQRFHKRQALIAKDARKSSFFLATLPNHGGVAYSADVSPDSRRVVSGGDDGDVIISDAVTGKELSRLSLGPFVTRIAFSPSGTKIGIETGAGWASVWNGTSARLPYHIAAKGNFNSLVFAPDGRSVVTVGAGGSASIWDVRIGTRYAVFHPKPKGRGDSVAISPDSNLVALATDGTVRVWNARGLVKKLRAGRSPTLVAFDPVGRHLLTVAPGRVALWNIRTWRPVGLPGAPHSIQRYTDGGFPDLGRLASFSADKVAIVGGRDVVVSSFRGKRLATIRESQAVTVARFSPDGSVIATGTTRGRIEVWSPRGRRLAVLLRAHSQAVESLAFSRDGRILVSAADDGTSTTWNIRRLERR